MHSYLDSDQVLHRGSVDDDGDARYSHLSQNVPDGFVFDLQADLVDLGFTEAGNPDGAFGRDTKRAVQAFEQAAGIEPNGVVEGATRNELRIWLREGHTRNNPPERESSTETPAEGQLHLISPRVTHYSQGNSLWADRILGRNWTIQKQGCAISCIAMVFHFYGRPVTPLTLDQFLDANNGYLRDSVKWDVAAEHEANGHTALRYRRMNGSEAELQGALATRIAENKPTLVRVDYGSDTNLEYNHFVVGVGRTANGEFIMNDPATRRGDGYETLDDNVIETTSRKNGYSIVQLDWYDPA